MGIVSWIKGLFGKKPVREKRKTKKVPSANKHWKHKDKRFVRENWQTMSDKQMAEQLGRSEKAVKLKRQQIELIRKRGGNLKIINTVGESS